MGISGFQCGKCGEKFADPDECMYHYIKTHQDEEEYTPDKDSLSVTFTSGRPHVEHWNGLEWRDVDLNEFAVKLELLCEWLDAKDAAAGSVSAEVQDDLRILARILRLIGPGY